MKPIVVRGAPLAGGRLPALCAPLVGATREKLLEEAAKIAACGPDLVEWRVDFFERLEDTGAVIDAARAIRAALPGLPLLFTRRSSIEGGQPIGLSEPQVVALYGTLCEAGCAELVDFEMARDAAHVAAVREAAHRHGIGLVLSYHNFAETPSQEEMLARFRTAQILGGDVAKLAVMPRKLEDVLALLAATLEASQALDIPLISMSMGAPGSLSRVAGFAFGSALSFGVGAASSAPGQVPIEDLKTATAILRRALGG